MGTQNNWRGCNKCSVVFFDGFDFTKGVCPGGSGGHVAQSFNFQLPFGVAETATAQANWRGCDKCSGLFFAGFGDARNCPGDGGFHHANSQNFVLPHDVASTRIDQPGWGGCKNCSCLFFNGFPDNKGHCQGAGGGGHVMQSFPFVLPHWITPAITLTESLEPSGTSDVLARCSGFSPLNNVDLQYAYTVAGTTDHTFGPAPAIQTDNDGAASAPITRDGSQLPADAFNITVTGTDEATGTSAASNVLRPQVG
jgi:hypothetical protein